MKSLGRLVIVDGIRTPFAKMGTSLSNATAVDLGRTVVTNLVNKTGIHPELIDEVIFGCVSQPADSANIARVIALRSGLPNTCPAYTVHRNCASGLEALTTAACKAAAGQGEIFIVGGTESMSRIPLLFSHDTALKFSTLARAKSIPQKLKAFSQFRPKDLSPVIGLKLGLTDPVAGLNMGQTAENLAEDFLISREEQDEFALQSHLKATASREELADEICPTYPPGTTTPATEDNGVREAQTREALAKLRPVFDRAAGTVTAGNASQITDGAVALLVMTEKRAERLGLEPLGQLVDFHYSGCDPSRMGLGPAHSLAKLAVRNQLRPEDTDLVEINEAFAAQVIACQKLFTNKDFTKNNGATSAGLGEIPDELLNPLGGSIALGHPVGASGARLVLTALKQLQADKKKKNAYVSLCIGGGQGGAALLEKI